MSITILLLLCVPALVQSQNNVCNTYLSYLFMNTSKDCWYNPNVGKNTTELIEIQGYSYKSYSVQTIDGYILTVYRVFKNTFGTRVVFIHHGFGGDSTEFLLIGNQSIALTLVDWGYDVWLGNCRGTTYSRQHVNKNITEKEYWNFSFHEIGIYDLPPTMEMIANVTQSKIVYVGHSMGGTISFVYGSLMKEHSEKHLKAIVGIGASPYLEQYPSPFAVLFEYYDIFLMFADYFKVYSFTSKSRNQDVCSKFPITFLCHEILTMSMGPSDEITPDMVPLQASGNVTVSVKTLTHFVQIYQNGGRFAEFGNGALYPVENITLPVRLFYSLNDYLCSEEATRKLFDTVSSKDKLLIKIPDNHKIRFNHINYIFAKHLYQLMLPPFLEVINDLYL